MKEVRRKKKKLGYLDESYPNIIGFMSSNTLDRNSVLNSGVSLGYIGQIVSKKKRNN